jgi:hypothetical protein
MYRVYAVGATGLILHAGLTVSVYGFLDAFFQSGSILHADL